MAGAALRGELGEAEVKNLGLAGAGGEEVGGLDVAVDDALGVGGGEGIGDLAAQLQHQLGGQGPAGDAVLEDLAFEQLHSDEGLAVVLVNFMDGADVGVVEGSGGAGFAQEAFERLAVAGELFGQELESDEAAELGVFGLVDHTHATAAQLFQHAVV